MTHVATHESHVADRSDDDRIAAELEAYNRAFSELELPWRWDAGIFRDLLQVAADRDFVGAYIERNRPHLLRVYEKAFLRDLVLSGTVIIHLPDLFVSAHEFYIVDLGLGDAGDRLFGTR